MEYNNDYINLKYDLIECFLIESDKSVLDISYSIADKQITIQVVLIEGFVLSEKRMGNIKKKLADFEVVVAELYLTKKQFNDGKGEWQPRYYKWLDYLLFSKAEVL